MVAKIYQSSRPSYTATWIVNLLASSKAHGNSQQRQLFVKQFTTKSINLALEAQQREPKQTINLHFRDREGK